jgi:hypothetical protein
MRQCPASRPLGAGEVLCRSVLSRGRVSGGAADDRSLLGQGARRRVQVRPAVSSARTAVGNGRLPGEAQRDRDDRPLPSIPAAKHIGRLEAIMQRAGLAGPALKKF